MIDPAEHPLRVRNNSEQTEPGAIRRGAMNSETLIITLFDADAFSPCDGVTDARLRSGRGDHDWIAYCADRTEQSLKARSVNAIVIGEEELHRRSEC